MGVPSRYQKPQMSDWQKSMMASALPTYQTVMALTMHFDPKQKYDWFKYGPLKRLTVDSLARSNMRKVIMQLDKTYSQRPEEELLCHIVAQGVVNGKVVPKMLMTRNAFNTRDQYIAENKAFAYNFKTYCEDVLFPRLLANGITFNEYIKCRALLEPSPLLEDIIDEVLPLWVVVGINRITKFMGRYDEMYKRDMFWPDVSQRLKMIDNFYVFEVSKITQQDFVANLKKNGLL